MSRRRSHSEPDKRTDVEKVWAAIPAVIDRMADRAKANLHLTHEEIVEYLVKPEHRRLVFEAPELFGGETGHHIFEAHRELPGDRWGSKHTWGNVTIGVRTNQQHPGFLMPRYVARGESYRNDGGATALRIREWAKAQAEVCNDVTFVKAQVDVLEERHSDDPHMCRYLWAPILPLAEMARDEVVRDQRQERVRLRNYMAKLGCYKAPTHMPDWVRPAEREELKQTAGIFAKWQLLADRGSDGWHPVTLVYSHGGEHT